MGFSINSSALLFLGFLLLTSTACVSAASNSTNSTVDCSDTSWPCSNHTWGNLVLLVLYGAVLAGGAKIISDGSELLMEILDPGIIGGFVLPVLGAVPDAAIVLVSGFGPDAQQQLNVGIGTLAGSTIFLMTVPWVASMFLARCDIRNGQAVDKTLTTSKSLSLNGITYENDVRVTAGVAMVSSLSYFIIQGVAFAYLHDPLDGRRLEGKFALATFIICALLFIAYVVYQVVSSKRQEAKMALIKEEAEKAKMLLKWKSKIFTAFDIAKRSKPTAVTQDTNENTSLNTQVDTAKYFGKWKSKTLAPKVEEVVVVKEEVVEESSDSDSDEEHSNDPKWKIALKATILLIVGVGICALFSDPMVDSLSNLGTLWRINPFYISFVVSPICSNASETISSLIFAAKKRKKNTTVTYAQLFGAVTMNNTLCLGIFVALVYFRSLVWTFSAETLCIFISTVIVGSITAHTNTLKSWWAIVVALVYPFALGLVIILENVVGWQ